MIKFMQGTVPAVLLCLLTACGGGGESTSSTSSSGSSAAVNNAPTVSITAFGLQLPASTSPDSNLSIALGDTASLDATSSKDADSDALAFEWSIASKPVGSAAVIASPLLAKIAFKPDLLGSYTLILKVTDSKGGVGTQIITVQADDRVPVSSTTVTTQFNAVTTSMPTQSVTVGANIVLNSTGATGPDGVAVYVAFELVEKPPTSTAGLNLVGKTSRLVADVQGTFKIRARGSDGKGGSFESIYSFLADNRAPNAVVVTGITPVANNAGDTGVTTSVGYDVLLDGTTSSDADGDTLTKAWAMTSRPNGSAAVLSSATANMVSFAPDLLGTYVLTLTVTDTKGAQSVYTKRVTANNRRPTANIGTNATPRALPSVPNILLPLGTELTLRGSLSVDADGDAMSYLWSIDSRPLGSTAALTSMSVADPKFVADKEGAYVFRLRVTDPAGAYSERTIGVDIGTHTPVAVLNRGRMSVLLGSAVNASAALSYDEDGDPLSFAWSIDAKPVGSSAVIGTANTSSLAFTPDMAGTYVFAVTVSDGRASSVAYLNVQVLATINSSVPLNFVPDKVKYSVGLDKLIVTATNPDTLRIVDPFVGSIRSVTLPLPVKNLGLSPDGKLAGVLHEGIVSLVDLVTGSIIRSTSTGGAQTDVFVMNSGVLFLIGQTGGQWVNEPVVAINGYTGAKITQGAGYLGSLYGTQYGVLAEKLNKVFLMELGLSPADIHYFEFNPNTYQATKFGDSPYHGDYSMSVPLYLSENQSILFTSYGNYFRTDTLQYAGALSGVTRPLSLSNSALQEETLVLQAGPSTSSNYPYPPTLPSSYKRFTGALFLPDSDMPLPLVGGLQSYGLNIFHSASGKHVVLVQTKSNEINGTGAQFAVITR